MSETVVLLHGFAGTGRHWDRVVALTNRERYSPVAIELVAAHPLSLAGAVELIAGVDAERFVLCGYSMGGRVALHVAAALGERVSRLVLISTSAGIEEAGVRVARASADEALAASIEAGSIEDFITSWSAVPLFADDPEWVKAAIADDERRLTPEQIAAMLRAYGAGVLEPLWERLGSLTMPAVVLSGERDAAYCELGRRMTRALPLARLEIVAGAGHRVALEAPQAVVDALARHATINQSS